MEKKRKKTTGGRQLFPLVRLKALVFSPSRSEGDKMFDMNSNSPLSSKYKMHHFETRLLPQFLYKSLDGNSEIQKNGFSAWKM